MNDSTYGKNACILIGLFVTTFNILQVFYSSVSLKIWCFFTKFLGQTLKINLATYQAIGAKYATKDSYHWPSQVNSTRAWTVFVQVILVAYSSEASSEQETLSWKRYAIFAYVPK